MDDIDSLWNSFISNTEKEVETKERVEKKMPTCDPLSISTETKIVYLNIEINQK